MTSEHELQSQILDLIRMRGGVATRVNSGGSITKRGGHISLADKGTSDLICCFKGHYLAIEVKCHPNMPTPEQILFGRMVNSAGGIFLVAYDIDDVNRELDILERGEQ